MKSHFDLLYISENLGVSVEWRAGWKCYQYVPEKKLRTLKQNALYWKMLNDAEKQINISFKANDLHNFFKYTFIARPLLILTGRETKEFTIEEFLETYGDSEVLKELCYRFSTTTLSTKEFKEYIENVDEYLYEYYEFGFLQNKDNFNEFKNNFGIKNEH